MALVSIVVAVSLCAVAGQADAAPAPAASASAIDPGFALSQLDVGGAPVDVLAGDDGTVWVARAAGPGPGPGPGGVSHLNAQGSGTNFAVEVPNALASDNEGGVWATVPETGRIMHIDRIGSVESWWAPTANAVPVAAYDSGGYVYFIEENAKRLGRIDQVTGAVTDFPIPGAVSPDNISGIADADGSHHTVWVTDPGAGRVWVLGTDGAWHGSIDSLGAVSDIQLLASVDGLVEGIASTDDSLLYFKQTPGSTPVTELIGGRHTLTGIQAYDGGVWTTDSGSDSLIFFKNGTVTEYASPTLGGSLSGIAITEGRYVWTAGHGAARLVRLDLQAKRTVDRRGGADRFEVSAQVSASTFPGGARTVFIASGEGFADALSVAPLAARATAPLLLTTRSALPPSVAAELARLGAERVVIVGGTDSIGAAVEVGINESAPAATITRIDGRDRYAVSRALLTGPFAPGSASTLFIANGANFPDALSSGPAAGVNSTGVLLVDGASSTLSSQELDLIRGFVKDTGTVTIVGGPNSVSAAIEAQIKAVHGVERIGGADRFEVSQALNARLFPRPWRVYLANGYTFADALSGGVAAAIHSVPLYLSRTTCIPSVVAQSALSAQVAQVTLLGGPLTLSPAVESLSVCP